MVVAKKKVTAIDPNDDRHNLSQGNVPMMDGEDPKQRIIHLKPCTEGIKSDRR